MDVKKEYMKIFSKNLFLNSKKTKKVKQEVSDEIDEILSRYDNQKEAFNEEMEGAIPKAIRMTKNNAEYLEDMGIINAIRFAGKVPHVSIKSKKEMWGMPLIHFASGFNSKKGDYDVAKGIVAIGSKARGIIALGKLAYGLIAIGGISLGVLSFGIISAGVFSAAGIAFALLLAVGGISISAVVSMGIVALSSLAASGRVAMAHFVQTGQKVSENIPGWFSAMSNNIGMVILIFEVILFGIILLIFYLDLYIKN